MSFTGLRFVDVKYSVSTWIDAARRRPRMDRHDPDDRRDDADGPDEQREHDADGGLARVVAATEREEPEDHRRDERYLVGLEEVGGHARAVTDVVTDVVGDHRSVARVV